MPKINIPIEETYKAIKDRFPNNLAAKHLENTKAPDIDIVKTELYKIVTGNDLDGGYNSEQDKQDAKKYLAFLSNPEFFI